MTADKYLALVEAIKALEAEWRSDGDVSAVDVSYAEMNEWFADELKAVRESVEGGA